MTTGHVPNVSKKAKAPSKPTTKVPSTPTKVPSTPTKAGGKAKAKAKAKEPKAPIELQPSASLLQEAKSRLEEAEEKQANANAALTSTFERRLALQLKESGRIKGGTKEETKALLREFDSNGDGKLQKIELRQMVRNKLKMTEDNPTIDALFDAIDEDQSGTIDLDELTAACHRLLEEHYAACEEREAIHDKVEALRERAELLSAAAESTKEFEEEMARRVAEEAQVQAASASQSGLSAGAPVSAPAGAPAGAAGMRKPNGGTGRSSTGKVTIDPLTVLRTKAAKLQAAVRTAAESSFKGHEQSFMAREESAKARAERNAQLAQAKAGKKRAAQEKREAERKAFEAKVEAKRREKALPVRV